MVNCLGFSFATKSMRPNKATQDQLELLHLYIMTIINKMIILIYVAPLKKALILKLLTTAA